MSDGLDPVPLPEGLGIPTQDWQQTPTSVQHQFLCLLKRVDALEARLNRDSSNSSRPPSTDAASQKRQRRTPATERRKPGAKPGHPGHPQARLDPTITMPLFPERCSCGQLGCAELLPYHTHQVIALPVIRPTVTHWMLHQGRCLSCGTLCKASLPVDQASGYSPRLTAFVGERAGIVSTSRSMVQDPCASVCSLPLSKGAIRKMSASPPIATPERTCC